MKDVRIPPEMSSFGVGLLSAVVERVQARGLDHRVYMLDQCTELDLAIWTGNGVIAGCACRTNKLAEGDVVIFCGFDRAKPAMKEIAIAHLMQHSPLQKVIFV